MSGNYLSEKIANKRGQQLQGHYWYPKSGENIKAIIFISHGFSEHLGLYHEVGETLAGGGFLAYGHDHVGHGRSEGKRVYVETVDEYVDDVIHHAKLIQEKYPGLAHFIVGHSMGGMITLKTVLRHPDFFRGMVLEGPLIVPGPQIGPIDFRLTPWRTFFSKNFLGGLSYFIPEWCLGRPNLEVITRDRQMQEVLKNDKLRWTGGCKVQLLLAFVNCMDFVMNQLKEIRIPYLTLHGDNDSLCNPLGSQLLYSESVSEDKQIKKFPGACHQLFFEFPAVRKEALEDVVSWITARM